MCADPYSESAATERLRQHARDFKNEHQAAQAITPRDWPSDADLAAMVSSGAIEGRRRKNEALGLFILIAPWLLVGLFFAGYFSQDIVDLFARLVRH